MNSAYRAGSIRGFTLIEVMIALALLSLLSVGILSSFWLGEKTFRRITTSAAAEEEILLTHRFLRRSLESVYPFQPRTGSHGRQFGLQGTSASLIFTALMPAAGGSQGYYRYEVTARGNQEGLQDVVARWALDRNGAEATVIGEEVLLKGAQQLQWSYQPSLEGGTQNQNAHWRPDWADGPALPALIRLTVTFPKGDERHWTELLVAPRTNADALCPFDPISEDCRASLP